MKQCYYCGNKAKTKEYIPPKQMFKGFKVNSMTVYSCEKHNTDKSGMDDAIIKSMLLSIEMHKDEIELDNDIKLSLDMARAYYSQVKRKVSKRTIYRQNNIDYNFSILDPSVDLIDWIRKLSAGLINYETNCYNSNDRFNESFVFERNSYPIDKEPKDLTSFENEYNKKIKFMNILEEGDWKKGWKMKEKGYPDSIYDFYYKFSSLKIIIKHIFYQQYTYYNGIDLSNETIEKIIKQK
jgi:hypothetical protein